MTQVFPKRLALSLLLAAAILPATFASAGQNASPLLKVAEPITYFLPKHVLALDITAKTETRRDVVRVPEGGRCDAVVPVYPVTMPPPPRPPAASSAQDSSLAASSRGRGIRRVQASTAGPSVSTTPPGSGLAAPKAMLCINEITKTMREVSAALRLVPDLKAGPHALATGGGGNFTDRKVSVEFRDGGILKSLNASSAGRAGDALLGVAKFAGTLLGMAPFGALGASTDAPPTPTACNPFHPPYRDLPDNVRLFLSRNERACNTSKEIEAKSAHLRALSGAVATTELGLGGTSGPALEDLIKRLKDQRKAVDDVKKEISALQETFNAALDEFVKRNKLGTQSSTSTMAEMIELFELPQAVKPGQTGSEVAAVMRTQGKTVAAQLLERTGVIATANVVASDAVPLPNKPEATRCAEKSSSDNVEIRFRVGKPLRLQFFVSKAKMNFARPGEPERNEKGVVVEQMVLASDRLETAMLPGIAPGCVALKASAFAKREITVLFDDKGQLMKVDQAAEGSASAIATALASSSTAFRDQYASTLGKVVEIQDAKRKIELGSLTTRIDELKKQRELLDAQLSLDATSANFDLALRRQQLAAELAELEAQTSLQTAQATADNKVELEQMKVEIALIKQELELIKAKADLASAKR